MDVVSDGRMIDGHFCEDYEEHELELSNDSKQKMLIQSELPSNHLQVSNGNHTRCFNFLLHLDGT